MIFSYGRYPSLETVKENELYKKGQKVITAFFYMWNAELPQRLPMLDFAGSNQAAGCKTKKQGADLWTLKEPEII